MQIVLSFGSVEEEVARKNASMFGACADAEIELLSACALKMDKHLEAVERALAFVKSLRLQDGHHANLQAYLAHPLRVARQAMELEQAGDLDTVFLGLLHNVIEVCGLSEDDLEKAGYSNYISRGVRLLTIDREQETNPEYLSRFYGAIEAYGERLSLIRCVDKLDNLLGLELYPNGEIRSSYLDLAEQFVYPMAFRLEPGLGRFFKNVVSYMRSRGCNPALHSQYEQFMSTQLSA